MATVMGRYYAMDRDNRWDQCRKAYRALVYGEGEKAASGPAGIQASYDRDTTDEFVLPTVVEENGHPTAVIRNQTLSFSLISVRTGQEKLPVLFVMMILPDSKEESGSKQPMYALPSMM